MAKMHSKKRGTSGSKKPSKIEKKSWVQHSDKEVEKLVLKLAKQHNPSMIGIILRDSYGIPNVKIITGKKIGKIIEENKLQKKIPEDLFNLIKKSINLIKHLETNKKDMTVKRGLRLTESKIGRLTKYYVRTGKIPEDWKYERNKAKLLIA